MKRFIFVVVAVVVVLTIILSVGCGQTVTTTPAQVNTLDKVIQNSKVRVGTFADYAPWGSLNAEGELEGYDIDLSKKLAEALGVEVEFVTVEPSTRIPALVTDKIDVAIGVMTTTHERAKTIDFTQPYAQSGLSILAWADDDSINSIEDLAGKKVSVVRGTTPEEGATANCPQGTEIISYDVISDAYTAFKTKKVDAFIEEETFIVYQVSQDSKLKYVGEPFYRTLTCFGVKKNDQEWLNYLNNFLMIIRYSGENADLFEKWFGFPPVPIVIQ